MYSVVLMAALTSGGDVPALGHNCGGCYGCYGGGYGGCYGGCYGGGHGCRGGHHRNRGCCGGGYGGCYGSCYGGGHGCRGGHHRNRGCCGCCGGGYGGCMGYAGGCSGACYGGCYGGMGVGGMGGVVVPPVAPTAPAAPTTPSNSKTKTSLDNAAPATLIVSVPTDARLTIDGEATTSTATQRVFVSPALDFGREYHYTLQAEFQKDGKKVTMTKEVAVQAGEQTRVNFDADNSPEIAAR